MQYAVPSIQSFTPGEHIQFGHILYTPSVNPHTKYETLIRDNLTEC
jgi:hypothetical protein